MLCINLFSLFGNKSFRLVQYIDVPKQTRLVKYMLQETKDLLAGHPSLTVLLKAQSFQTCFPDLLLPPC